MERYVIHMKDEGNGSYYLTEDKELFRHALEVDDTGEDEHLMEFMNDNEHLFEIVYSLDGIHVIESMTGYFY